MVKASKEKEARQLRAAGASYRSIAGRLNVPLSTAFRWCASAAGAPPPKAAGERGQKDVKAAPGDAVWAAVPALDGLEAVWAEFDKVYQQAQERGQLSQQIRMLLGRAESLRREFPMVPTCVGHISRQLYNDRISEARDMNLAVVEAALRLDGEARGLYKRISDTWRMMIQGWNLIDSDMAGDDER